MNQTQKKQELLLSLNFTKRGVPLIGTPPKQS